MARSLLELIPFDVAIEAIDDDMSPVAANCTKNLYLITWRQDAQQLTPWIGVLVNCSTTAVHHACLRRVNLAAWGILVGRQAGLVLVG